MQCLRQQLCQYYLWLLADTYAAAALQRMSSWHAALLSRGAVLGSGPNACVGTIMMQPQLAICIQPAALPHQQAQTHQVCCLNTLPQVALVLLWKPHEVTVSVLGLARMLSSRS